MVKVLLIHYRLSKEQPLTVAPWPYPHWRPVCGSPTMGLCFLDAGILITRTSGRSAPIVLVPAFDQDKLNVV